MTSFRLVEIFLSLFLLDYFEVQSFNVIETYLSSGTLANLIFRQKRQSPGQCVGACTKSFESYISKYLPETKDPDGNEQQTLITLAISGNQLRTFCSAAYAPFAKCVAACPDSKEKKTSELMHTFNKFMCVDNFDKISKYLQCYQDVKKVSEIRCIKNTCKRFENATSELLRASQNGFDGFSEEQIRNLFGNNCKQAKCVLPCELPLIDNKCGANAADIYANGTSQFFPVADQILQLSGKGSLSHEECKGNLSLRLVQPSSDSFAANVVNPDGEIKQTTTPGDPGNNAEIFLKKFCHIFIIVIISMLLTMIGLF